MQLAKPDPHVTRMVDLTNECGRSRSGRHDVGELMFQDCTPTFPSLAREGKLLILTIVWFGAQLLFLNIAFAERFELIKGKDKAVCTAYLESLERSSARSLTQLICDRPKFARSLRIERFSTTDLDLWEHRAFYNDANRYLRDAWGQISEDKAEFDEYRRLGGPPVNFLTFPREVDLDNDGSQDRIVKIRRESCGKPSFYEVLLVAQETPDVPPRRLNEIKIAKVLYGSGLDGRWNSVVMDVFRFRGEHYFDFVPLARADKDRNVFYIWKLDKGEDWPINVCQIKPIPRRQK